jgi:8-oxo-dGTP diphosphatase
MKARRLKSFASPIMAAGGIVIAPGRTPLVAVVQRRKDNEWVLPKGKLKPRESALAAAQREAREETGHRVAAQDYLGVVSYETSERPKIVQFWRMRSLGGADHPPMRDIKAVKWLPLDAAIARLTFPVERAFLAHIGERAMKPVRRPPATKVQSAPRPMHETGKSPTTEHVAPPDNATPGAATANVFRRLFLRLHASKGDRSATPG